MKGPTHIQYSSFKLQEHIQNMRNISNLVLRVLRALQVGI